MKNKKLLLTLGIILITSLSFSQNVYIPDANFKNALLISPNSVDTNNDGEIQMSEAIAYTNPIDVTAKNINDLTGIEAFVNIPILACGDNNLTKLNVSQNINLERLFCMNNQIERLVLSSNTKLTLLYSYNNDLSRLTIANGNNTDLTIFNTINNPNLKCIQIDSGFTPTSTWSKDNIASYSTYPCKHTIKPIRSIKTVLSPLSPNGNKSASILQNVHIPDVNFKNALLAHTPIIDTNNDGEIQVNEAHNTQYLNVGYKNISDLTGIENFINLTTLACAGNNLTNLNISQNVNLEFLYSASNPIKKLSLIKNTKLTNLSSWYCSELKTLDVSNGYNSIITTFDVTNSPNLKCIKIDNGFTPPSNWNKDNVASYSIYPCPYSAALPDKGFFSPMTPITGNKIGVYPNPTSDYLNIKSNNKSEIKIVEIYNTNGYKIIETKSKLINVSSLQKGIYHLKIVNNKNEITHKKFVKK